MNSNTHPNCPSLDHLTAYCVNCENLAKVLRHSDCNDHFDTLKNTAEASRRFSHSSTQHSALITISGFTVCVNAIKSPHFFKTRNIYDQKF